MDKKQGSIGRGLFWMILLSVLLFWLPIVGSFLAGMVGGKKSGSLGNAMLAAVLPALIFGALLAFLATAFTGVPVIGLVAGLGSSIFALSNVFPLLLGAFIGGLMA